jgi:hypothetical protein
VTSVTKKKFTKYRYQPWRIYVNMNNQVKNCQNCKNGFVIEADDFGFYEKINVPPPTFCPDCRRQRRWAWRNNMSLYNRKCQLCDKAVVSLYATDSGITVYCNKCWWSDKWDPKSYAMDYDFSRPFFIQFNELMHKVPHMAVVNDDGIASVNCEYTHDWWFSKNCYMCFSGWKVQDVMYSFFTVAGKEMMDCTVIRSPSEKIYESFVASTCYNSKYLDICKNIIDSQFLFHCTNSQDCFMCYGLTGKKYFFKNKQYSKEEYKKILESYRLDTFSGVERARKEYDEFILGAPRRYANAFRIINSTGDLVSDAKNVRNSFVVKGGENVSYSDFSGDVKDKIKDSYDVTLTGGASECYETVVADHSQGAFFCLLSPKNMDVRYAQHCHSSKHLFGSIGIRNASYCIFNKQYTKEEYEELVPKIIEQMNSMPYLDKAGNVYKYGEFFPLELSTFGYNESCAVEERPLSKEEASKKGYNWQENTQKTEGKETLKPEEIPESITDIQDAILQEVLACIECNRNYKIVPNELIFYRKMGIPIPRRCFYCRHAARVKRRNPFKLWRRACMCEKENHKNHEGKCKVEFETTYSPDRPEAVYCEKCYQSEFF